MSASPAPHASARGVRWSRTVADTGSRRSSGRHSSSSWRPDDADLEPPPALAPAGAQKRYSGSGIDDVFAEDDNEDDDDDDDDDAPPPMMQLNPLTRALLERDHAQDEHWQTDSRTTSRLSRTKESPPTSRDTDSPAQGVGADREYVRRRSPYLDRYSDAQDIHQSDRYPIQRSNSRGNYNLEPERESRYRSPSNARPRLGSRASNHSLNLDGQTSYTNNGHTTTNISGHSALSNHSANSPYSNLSAKSPQEAALAPGTPDRKDGFTESTPAPALSTRIRRVGLMGAPVRRLKKAAVDEELADPTGDGPGYSAYGGYFQDGTATREVELEMDQNYEAPQNYDQQSQYPPPNRRYDYQTEQYADRYNDPYQDEQHQEGADPYHSKVYEESDYRDRNRPRQDNYYPSSRPISRDHRMLQESANDQENIMARPPPAKTHREEPASHYYEYEAPRDRQRERERPVAQRGPNRIQPRHDDELEQEEPEQKVSAPAIPSIVHQNPLLNGGSSAPAASTPVRTAPPSSTKTDTVSRTRRRRTHFTINGKQYAQIGRLGKGGSSEVFRVMSESGKMYALKRVRLDKADEAALTGFRGEIELLRALKDVDRVVELFDWQVDEVKQCLSVLLEAGETDLSCILRKKSSLDLPFVRYYWREMLECVAAVHEHDIIHSDLKPANFVLVSGALKLIDFGIAGAIDIDHTVHVHREAHVGTPNFMSPESLTDSNARRQPGVAGSTSRLMKLGKPADVWSLGCILYQLVYGQAPFAHIANLVSRIMTIIRHDEEVSYPLVGTGEVKVPPTVIQTIRRCLAWEPALRPTVRQLLAEDDPFLYPDEAVAAATAAATAATAAAAAAAARASEKGPSAPGQAQVKEDEVVMSRDLLGQIISRLAARFGDKKKELPTEEEVKQYQQVFFNRIKEYQTQKSLSSDGG